MLNLVHLKVLAAVARHGSVTEAAKELHYSQPSVSHHLARLESATGAKLIQRVGRGIELTLVDVHPEEALGLLRRGEIDVALIFRYADTPVEDEGFRLVHVVDDPVYLVSTRPEDGIAD